MFFLFAAVYSKLHPAAMGLADSIHLYLAEVLSVLTDDAFNAFPRLGVEVHLQVRNDLPTCTCTSL